MDHYLEYEVRAGGNVPGGLPRLRLPVLSPIWQGMALRLEYADGAVQTLVGWCGPGEGGLCEVQVFWTRHEAQGPVVCLAIGGDAGLRELTASGGSETARGLPFLALADSLIPPEVLAVIGPRPPSVAAPPAALLLS